jgi:hypothetical protein
MEPTSACNYGTQTALEKFPLVLARATDREWGHLTRGIGFGTRAAPTLNDPGALSRWWMSFPVTQGRLDLCACDR